MSARAGGPPNGDEELGFNTRALGAWKNIDEVRQRAPSPPIYQAATFIFDDMEEFAAIGQSKISGGYLYSRWANPTVDAVAKTIASLEGAEATACFASGMAAISTTLYTLARSGDHIVASKELYGGTHGVFGKMLPRAGVTATLVDTSDHDEVAAAFTGKTVALYAETITNPTMSVADVDALAAIARAHGVPLVVDATFTPPCALRPLEHGADLVVHSATKYLSGHSDVTAGVVSGRADDVARIRHTLIESGGILAPFEAWLLGRGVQTLSLRFERISDNALALARALEEDARVERVLYPGLESHPHHGLARKLLGERFGGMLAFVLAGGYEAGRRFMERARLASPAASLGGTKTLVVHPASITHTQLSREEREAIGIADGMIRVSVGIEDIDDLISDFEQALA
jgi:cystathionine beta-lyase/cystathionine gamma-synthase